MKRATIFLLAAILLGSMLLCGCQTEEPETEPDTELTTPDTTASETETQANADTEETVRQPYDPEAAGEIPPWETAMQEEEFLHTWNPSPTLKQQSFQILRFGEKYTNDEGNETIREDDWIVETRNCYVRMKMPSHWYWNGVSGTERKGDNSGVSLRLGYEKVLYRRADIPAHWMECATDMGDLYYRWEVENDGITEYHFAYPTRVALVDYWFEAIFYGHPDTIAEPSPEEYYDTYVKPMAESVQLETSGGGIPFETEEQAFRTHSVTLACDGYSSDPPADQVCAFTCHVTMDLPIRWEITEEHQAYDSVRREYGCLRDIRLEILETLRHMDLTAASAMENYTEQTTPGGRTYYLYTLPYEAHNPYTAVQNGQYLLPVGDETHFLVLNLFTYPAESDAPDPADYYDTHILPILDSIKIEIQQ